MSDLVDQYQQAKARSEMINAAQASAYFDMLFELVDWEPHHRIALRPIGEKTAGHGAFGIPPHYITPHGRDWEGIKAEVHQHITNWAKAGIAAYVLPAVLKEESAEAGAVEIVTAICCDLDRGDTYGALDYAAQRVGKPSMVVESGGVTQDGKPKLHAYWRLSEPTTDIHSTMLARQALVDKIGADPALGIAAGGDKERGRVHQPIRIAGSVHCKGEPKPVRIIYQAGHQVELGDFLEGMGELTRKPGLPEPVGKSGSPQSGQFVFGPEATGPQKHDPMRVFQAPVLPEGASGIDRWQAFTNGVGSYIAFVRQNGGVKYETALSTVQGMARVNLGEGWDDARVKREFDAIWKLDEKNHPERAPLSPAQQAAAQAAERKEWHVNDFGFDRFRGKARPPRRFIADGLVMARKSHMLVADGGAGKSLAALQLAVMVAGPRPCDSWLGAKIVPENCGAVVFITTEEDEDDIVDRLHDLGLMERANQIPHHRLRIITTISVGGAFSLMMKDRRGNVVQTADWNKVLLELEQSEVPVLVVLDTVNSTMHGDENSAQVSQEFTRAAMQVCGRLGAALLMLHHPRKADAKTEVRTPDDFRATIRGSSALVSSCRAVIGIWHDPDYRSVLEDMGEPVRDKALYRAAIVKGNSKGLRRVMFYLLRHDAGYLVDATASVRNAIGNSEESKVAWVLGIIKDATDQGYPLPALETWERIRRTLPDHAPKITKKDYEAILAHLFQVSAVEECAVDHKEKRLRKAIVPAGSAYLSPGVSYHLPVGSYKPRVSGLVYDPMSGGLVFGS